MSGNPKSLSARARDVREAIWRHEDHCPWYIVLMRICAIFWRGALENTLFNRAAALSYSSLLALAPILGVLVLLSGSFLGVNSEARIKHGLLFIAPSLREVVEPEETLGAEETVDPELVQQQREMKNAFDMLINHMVNGVRNNVRGVSKGGKSVASVIGVGMLVWMGLTLLFATENAMNSIWGVRNGRSWGKRFVLYWTVLSLGLLATLAMIAVSSTTKMAKVMEALPFGSSLAGAIVFISPVLAVAGLAIVLTCFYKFFPNTRVRLKPALVGGLVVALLLVANDELSMMYIRSVISIQSLFGSVGIILVMMLGLYLFWAFLLMGAQLTYAVQNAQFLADQKAWRNASERTRETLTFAAFVVISRRFVRCQSPLSADEIAESMRVPTNILNECLDRLCEMGLVTPLSDERDDRADRVCFTPARPLNSVTFASFRGSYAAQGTDTGVTQLREVDPLVDLYRRRMEEANSTIAHENIEALLQETDPDKHGAPAR